MLYVGRTNNANGEPSPTSSTTQNCAFARETVIWGPACTLRETEGDTQVVSPEFWLAPFSWDELRASKGREVGVYEYCSFGCVDRHGAGGSVPGYADSGRADRVQRFVQYAGGLGVV